MTVTTDKPLVCPEIPVVETDRDKFAANRTAITAALRAHGDKQILGQISDGMGGFCFVGLGDAVLDGRV